MRSQAIKVVRIGTTLLLFGYVIYRTGLLTAAGWRHFTKALAGADPGLLLLSLGMSLVLDLISAVKWRVLSASLGLPGGTMRLFAYYLSGRFLNLVLPSNIGGDYLRVTLQGQASGQMALSAASVFMDRLTGFAVLLAIALGVTFFNATALDIPYIEPAIAVSMVGVGILLWLVVDRRTFDLVRAFGTHIIPRTEPLFGRFDRIHDAVQLYRNHPRGLMGSMLVSLIFYASCGINFWVNLLVFDASTPLVWILIATPLMMVIMNIPLSIGNVGVLEFSYTVTLGAFGVPPTVALSAALLDRFKSIVAAGLGAIIYNVIKARARD